MFIEDSPEWYFYGTLEITMWLSLKPVFIVLIKQMIFLDDLAEFLRFVYYLTLKYQVSFQIFQIYLIHIYLLINKVQCSSWLQNSINFVSEFFK